MAKDLGDSVDLFAKFSIFWLYENLLNGILVGEEIFASPGLALF